MIFSVYNSLIELVNKEFKDICEDAAIMFSTTGRAQKMRIYLIDNTIVDIWIFMHKSPCPLPYKSNYRIRLSKFKRLHQCPHICPKKYKDVIINHTYKRSFFNHEGKNKTG